MKKEPNTKSLLDRWKNRAKKEGVSLEVTKAPDSFSYSLSNTQERLWFLQQLYPNSAFYNLSEYYRFEGELNTSFLKESIKLIFGKHQILKSYYPTENDKAVLKIDDSNKLVITEKDFSNYSENEAEVMAKVFIEEQAHFNFKLSSAPLIKVSILKVSKNKHILLLTLHHIITDQWSMEILKEELAFNYKKLSIGLQPETTDNSINFIDYAYWQNNKQTYDTQKAYWRHKLAGDIPILSLPTDFNRPTFPSYKGKNIDLKFSKMSSTQILELAKKLEVTPFVLFLSAYYILLKKFCKQDDILIGSPVSNRNKKGLESVFGLFIDTVVFRASVKKSLTISQFIKEVNTMSMEALSNKDIPFDVVVKELNFERSLGINPLFQVMFVYASKPQLPSFGSDLELIDTVEYSPNVSKFDLTLFVTENKGELTSAFEYATDLFEEESINRFQQHLKHTLEYIVKHTDKTLASIPALIEADEKLLIENNITHKSAFQDFQSIHSIIEDVALKHPNNIALTYGESSITYKTLNEKANRVALDILKNSNQNKIVGLCIERSLNMIIGMLGILKAGFGYLPIDPEYPKQRINFMLSDAKVKTIVSQNSLLNLFDEFKINSVSIDGIDNSSNETNINLPMVKETDLAYIIYTSGSTGKPKGVPITHKNIINSTAGRLNFYNENPSAFLLMSSISFDSSKAGIFWTLCTGGNLVISEKRIEQDIIKIANIIEQYHVSHTLMLPSLYKVILENVEIKKLESLKTAIVAGEACSKSLCNVHFKTLPNVSLYNEYGPTEASVWCIAHKIETKDLKKPQIPIGKPVANAQIYLLDDNKNKVPFGTSGEIYVGGDGLSNGYLYRPELTNKMFIENPFNQNQKLYKTGDLAKYRNDGTIDFLGRIDQQIKIRGYRVELDDIENTINKSTLVEKSVVIVKLDEGKPKRLIAYLKPNDFFDENRLKLKLKEELPNYMIPSSFVLIGEIPLLPNGKVDKKTLSLIEIISNPKDGNLNDKPKNDIEQKLLEIWKNIISINELSTKDNFFEIGGDSILSIQIIAKARKLGIAISPNQIFEHQTISELAMFVSLENDSNNKNEAIIYGDTPLLPIQKWFFETHKNAPEYWNQGFSIKELPETTNANFVKEITDNVIKNHDALRTSFIFKKEEWVAKILKPEDLHVFYTIDLSNEITSNYNSRIEDTLKSIQENIQLEKGSLFKCIYFETGNSTNNFIILLAHHMVIDFVSWQIILNYYTEALLSNKLNTIFKTSSIKTWGEHLLKIANSKAIKDDLNYWKEQVQNKRELPKDFECTLPLFEKDVSLISLEIEKDVTENLLNNANEAYSTKIDELLIAAFAITISNWSNNNEVLLAMERHGRETMHTGIDLSNTSGWFTAFFPKKLSLDSNANIGSKIIAIKEEIRNIPNGGIGYGVLQYLSSDIVDINFPEIIFNYLGKQSTNNSSIEFISENVRHPLSERHYFMETNILIKNGVLSINWSYATKAYKAETIQLLINQFSEVLKEITVHCMNNDDIKYTPSDFQDVDLDQDDLDTLLNDLDL